MYMTKKASQVRIKNQEKIEDEYHQLVPKEKVPDKQEMKKEIMEDYERLDATGQEDEKKAVKWVQEDFKEDQTKQFKVEGNQVEWLERRRKRGDEDYLVGLASILWHQLKAVSWPLGFHFKVELEGVRMKATITDNYGREFAKGVKVCGDVKYDHHAVNKIAVEAENTLDQIESNDEFNKTDGGIYLP